MDKSDKLKCVVPALAPNLDQLCGSALLADRVRALLHNLYVCYQFANVKTYWDAYFHDQGWVTIPAKRFEMLLTNRYTDILDFAEYNGLIEIKRNEVGNKSYWPEHRSTPYRINPALLPNEGKRFRIEHISSYKVIKSINRYNSRKYAIDDFELTYDHYDGLNEMLDHFYFDQALFDDIDKGRIKLNVKKGQTSENRIRNLSEASMVAELINDGQKFRTSVCTFGERYHSVFTRLPSEFRNYLRLKDSDEKILMLDIKNSQLYCLALLLSHPEKLTDILPDFKPVLDYFRLNKGRDRRLFMEYCANGSIYDFWQEYRGHKSRNDAKDELIKGILFEKPHRRKNVFKKARQGFNLLFPDVWKCILTIKNITEEILPCLKDIYLDNKNRYDELALHKTVCLMCQRLESRLLLGKIAQKLLCDCSIKPFLTIHDSILFPESDLEKIKNAFSQCFQDLGIPEPTLKLTRYPVKK